ncbi:potassium channel family protein [Fibrobacter sp.]|uniref:potassium channel family protein n=1 Tax=Fibrobacter sp. TaxID=35828 RepID=UPI0038673FBD
MIDNLRESNLNDRSSIYEFFKNKENYENIGLQQVSPQINGGKLESSLVESNFDGIKGSPTNPCVFQDCVLNLYLKYLWDSTIEINDFDPILLRNTVVFGNLFINFLSKDNECSHASISFDNVIVFGKIEISSNIKNIESISIRNSAVDEIFCSDIKLCEKFDIYESSIGTISFHDVKIKDLRLCCSQIEAVRINDNVFFEKKRTCRTDINVDKTFDLNKRDIYDYKWNTLPKTRFNAKTARMMTDDSREIIFQKTFEFLKSFPVGISLKDSAAITTKKLFHDNKKSKAYFHLILNFFLNPWIVLIVLFVIIGSCTWLYEGRMFYATFSSRSEPAPLSCGEALYYSLVSFTTIGYGDFISSDPLVRVVSTIEGLLGILLGGAFLVALTRTYLDFHNDRFKN